jgi:hypothetical protein
MLASASGAYVRNTRFYLQAKQGGKTVPLALASLAPGFQYDGANFRSAVSQPVDFFVPAGETLQIFAWPTESPNSFIDRMDCTVAGEMKDASTPGLYLATAHAQCPEGFN